MAMLTRNRIEFFEILFGCAKLGAILVPLNWRMPPAELDGLIADCRAGPAASTAPARRRPRAALAAPPPAIDFDGDYEALLAAAPARRWRAPLAGGGDLVSALHVGNDRAAQGRDLHLPDGARELRQYRRRDRPRLEPTRRASFLPDLPHRRDQPPRLADPDRRRPGDRHGRLRRRARWSPCSRRGGSTPSSRCPTVYQSLLDHPRFAAAPLDACPPLGLRRRAAARRARRRAAATLGIRVCNGMGMTETGPTAFLVDPGRRLGADRLGRQAAIAVPRPDRRRRRAARCRTARSATSSSPGPGVTPGYWRNEEATRAAFTADGWLISGDLARRDADGFFWIAGRRKEMFISGGENVYPAEVENVLSAHPAIVDAAVLAEADPKWGEVGRAFVQLAPDGGASGAGRAPGLLPRPPRPLQGAAALRLRRRIPAHLGRQDPEASASDRSVAPGVWSSAGEPRPHSSAKTRGRAPSASVRVTGLPSRSNQVRRRSDRGSANARRRRVGPEAIRRDCS